MDNYMAASYTHGSRRVLALPCKGRFRGPGLTQQRRRLHAGNSPATPRGDWSRLLDTRIADA
eukprot:9720556-Prorocentrum_lima.AAC.1